MKHLAFPLHFALIALFAVCALGQAGDELTVYSHRHYDADKKLYAAFEEQTGITVTVLSGNADQLLQRLEMEGERSPADLFVTADAGRLHLAREKGLLQSVQTETLTANVPAHLRDPDGQWYGLTYRARVIVYNKQKVKPSELSTYEALTEPQWKGRILVRSSSNIYNQSLLASLIVAQGEKAALSWAEGIVANLARTPKGSDRDQMKAVVEGQGDIAIVNTYYLGLLLHSEVEAEREVGRQLGVFFPNQGDRGTHVNVSGAGVTACSDNREAAIKLLEFLLSEEAQRVFAEANHEYPVRPGVAASETVAGWGSFRPDPVNLAKLGEQNAKAVQVFDAARWR